MRKIKHPLSALLLAAGILTTAVFAAAHLGRQTQPQTDQILPSESQASVQKETISPKTSEEFRGVWIPCMSLVLDKNERTEEAFRKKINSMLKNCASCHLNTVIVHVRPFADALYPSAYYPWSHVLSGRQGEGLSFDPLKIIAESAHRQGLKIHAWINPFRVSTGQTPPALSSDNPAEKWRKNPQTADYVMTSGEGLYLNPAYPAVRRLIIDGVRELLQGYALDGIQIDDYFYPDDDTECDRLTYDAYVQSLGDNSRPLSQQEWRKQNVNMLMAGIYSAVHHEQKGTVFIAAPQGNFENNEKMAADVTRWCCESGYVDGICPQLYVSNEHPQLPFQPLADRWQKAVTATGVKWLGGLALYKAGSDADSGTWQNRDDILRQQIEYLRKKGAAGFVLYSYEYLNTDSTQKEMQNINMLLS